MHLTQVQSPVLCDPSNMPGAAMKAHKYCLIWSRYFPISQSYSICHVPVLALNTGLICRESSMESTRLMSTVYGSLRKV